MRKSRLAASSAASAMLPPLTRHRAEREPQRLAGHDVEARMRHPHQRLLAHDLDVVDRRAVGDQRDIELVAANALGERERAFADDRHLDERMLARKPFHDRRHEHFGVVVRNAEPHLAGEPLLADMHHRLGFDPQHLARELDQPLAVAGES